MSETDNPDIRIGDAERERAVEVLKEAAADGRLTLSELDERIDATLRSVTRADLRDVLMDLVPNETIRELLGLQSTLAQLAPGSRWDDPLVLMAHWEDVTRRGEWDIPPFLETHSVAASVVLDFTAARFGAPVIDISHFGGAGDLVLIVSKQHGVNTDRVTGGLGRVRNKANPRSETGQPQLLVRGSLGLGNIRVRLPNSLDRWLSDRALRSRGR